MKKCSARIHKGFISLYFLGVLLYVSTVCALILQNDMNRIRTITNLQEDMHYFEQEIIAVNEVKKALLQQSTSEEINLELSYSFELVDNTIYLTIESSYPEELQINYDESSFRIVDYSSFRY